MESKCVVESRSLRSGCGCGEGCSGGGGGFLPDCALIASNLRRVISRAHPGAKARVGVGGGGAGGRVWGRKRAAAASPGKNRRGQISGASETRTGDRKIRLPDASGSGVFPVGEKGTQSGHRGPDAHAQDGGGEPGSEREHAEEPPAVG